MTGSTSCSLDDPIPASIGAPALRALQASDIETYADLARWSERDLMALHGVGPKALEILGAGLAERDASFGPPSTA